MSHRSKKRNTRVPNTNRRLSFPKTAFNQSKSLQSPNFDFYVPNRIPGLHGRGPFAPRVIPAVIHQNVAPAPRPFQNQTITASPVTVKALSTCVQRKQRREVMFANNGAGSKKMSRPVHTQQSKTRC